MDVSRDSYRFYVYNFGSVTDSVQPVPNLDLPNDPVLLDTSRLEYDGSDLDVGPNSGRTTETTREAPLPVCDVPEPTNQCPSTVVDSKKQSSNIFICDRCNLAFTTETKLKRHSKTHLYEKPHKCDHCNEEFNVLENLMLHSALHNKPFRCPQCGKIFNRLSSLDGHIKSHFKIEYFVCPHCAEMFHYEARLKEHLRNVHPSENYNLQEQKEHKAKARKLGKGKTLRCKFCPKEFKKNCLLLRHERIHKGEKPFKCDTCGRNFVQKNSLVIHQLRHSGARPHRCPKCPQSFTQRGNLVVHQLRCHNEGNAAEFPYACTQCTCVFKKLGPLNAHITKCHSTVEPSESVADDDFGFKEVMLQLQNIRRPDPCVIDSADILPKSIIPINNPPTALPVTENSIREPESDGTVHYRSENLMSTALPLTVTENSSMEMAEHKSDGNVQNRSGNLISTALPVAGDSCMEVAEHKSDGTVQYRSVNQMSLGSQRWLICMFCPKKFRRPSDLLRHIRIHTKEKPFECPIAECKRRFAIKGTLNVHMRVHENTKLRHTCPTCSRKFSSATTLDIHCLAAHNGVLGFKCNQCLASFSQSQPFKVHLRHHHSDPQKETMRRAAAARHKKELLTDDPFQIQMDEPVQIDVFQTESPPKSSSSDTQTFHCEVCLLQFKRKHTLKQHMNTHRAVKPYQCQLCEKSFASSFSLKRHLQYHSSDKPFTCSICGVSFVTSAVLKRHSLKHSEVRNYMCPYCKKKFKSRTQCRQHMQLHKLEIMKHLRDRVVTVSTIHDTSLEIEEYQLVAQSSLDPQFQTSVMQFSPQISETQQTNENISIIGDNFPQQIEDIGVNTNDHIEYILVLDNGVQDQPHNQNTLTDEVLTQQLVTINDSSCIYLDTSLSEQNEPDNSIISSLAPIEPNTSSVGQHHTHSTVINTDVTPIQSGSRRSFQHPCPQCGKVFKKPVDLRRHVRTHTGERPFKCNRCTKAFSLLCTLNEHLKVHDNTKQKFPCHICRKTFTTKRSLGIHMLIHAGQKPYKCAFCALCFRTSGHQRRHERVHVKEAARLNCDPKLTQTKKATTKLQPLIEATEIFISTGDEMELTKLSFVEQIALRPDGSLIPDSTDVEVPETLWCYVCSADDNDNNMDTQVDAPKKEKSENKCSTCGKAFKKLSLLQRHMVVHTKEKPFPCSVCSKSFCQRASLTAHILTHNEEKLFKCSVCEKEFNYKTNLQVHNKRCGRKQI